MKHPVAGPAKYTPLFELLIGGITCNCYIGSRLKIACRHMILVRNYLATDLFSKEDFPVRWFRGFSGESRIIDVFENVIQDPLKGIMDKDMDVLSDGIRNSSNPVREAKRLQSRRARFANAK